MSESPPDKAELTRLLEELQELVPVLYSAKEKWRVALHCKIPGAITPVEWDRRFEMDYCEGSQIHLYRMKYPPVEDEPKREPLLREQIVVERTKGRLSRCYWSNPQPENPDPEICLTLDQCLVGGIREAITQVWKAHFTTMGKRKPVVAKFFDPLYFVEEDEQWTDPLKLVVHDISREFQAYKRLETMQRIGIPEFYGIYLAGFASPDQDTAAKRPSSRNVYVLLMEDVIGEPLNKVNPSSLEDTRKAIMNNVIELDNQARALGVSHGDLEPRNVILWTPPEADADPVVVMVDFADVTLFDSYPGSWDDSQTARGERLSKAKRYSYMGSNYPSWVSSGWFREDS